MLDGSRVLAHVITSPDQQKRADVQAGGAEYLRLGAEFLSQYLNKWLPLGGSIHFAAPESRCHLLGRQKNLLDILRGEAVRHQIHIEKIMPCGEFWHRNAATAQVGGSENATVVADNHPLEGIGL